MPDAAGNIKGISLSGVELPWEREAPGVEFVDGAPPTAADVFDGSRTFNPDGPSPHLRFTDRSNLSDVPP